VFCALDFFLFYVFWEVMLLPMYFLIGIWGGPRREYAAIKFFLYTLAGSVLMLLAMIAFYFNTSDPVTGEHTFNMVHYMFPEPPQPVAAGDSTSACTCVWAVHRLRDQGAGLPVPHLAARRARRGADGRSPSSWPASC
jgi:NADH:ubiquinone oxidoreductase subunit 5 (subunit L)/multisubunit Na+/H+ antiporter MnhA subunit